jgi:beta-N-acetylhexosaminidase
LRLNIDTGMLASAARIAALVPQAPAPDWGTLQSDMRYKAARKLAQALVD